MSLNSSLQHVTPFFEARSQAVHKSAGTNSLLTYGSYAGVEAQQKQIDDKDSGSKEHEAQRKSTGEGSANVTDQDSPEIFKLVTPPDFTGFFLLLNTEGHFKITALVRKTRKSRGITTQLPVSASRRESKLKPAEEIEQYFMNSLFFSNQKGARFTGEL